MRKRIGLLVGVTAIVLVALLCTLLSWPTNHVQNVAHAAYPGTPYCDIYGFTTPSNTWYNIGYHSGVERLWEEGNPSIHWTFDNHSPQWYSTSYKDVPVVYPDAYLNGNSLFIYFGDGSTQWLKFNGNYIYDTFAHRPSPNNNGSICFEDSFFQLDYMALAYLGACYSAWSNNTLAYYLRCVKGVDNVVGFNLATINGYSHEFAERFFCYTVKLGQEIHDAKDYALDDVYEQFNGSYGNTDSVELWCKDNPNGGHEKIWYPRWGSAG